LAKYSPLSIGTSTLLIFNVALFFENLYFEDETIVSLLGLYQFMLSADIPEKVDMYMKTTKKQLV